MLSCTYVEQVRRGSTLSDPPGNDRHALAISSDYLAEVSIGDWPWIACMFSLHEAGVARQIVTPNAKWPRRHQEHRLLDAEA